MADRKRRALARADHEILVAFEKKRQCKGATQPRQGRFHGLLRREALLQIGIDQMRNYLAVSFGCEFGALFFELEAQLAEILDDAIVNHRDVLGGMRMSVVLVRLAVRGPTRVPDTDIAGERVFAQSRFQIFQLAFGAPPLEFVALQRRDACRIIAAILKPLEGIDQLLRDRAASQDADNSAHADQYPPIIDCRRTPALLLTNFAALQVLNNYCLTV